MSPALDVHANLLRCVLWVHCMEIAEIEDELSVLRIQNIFESVSEENVIRIVGLSGMNRTRVGLIMTDHGDDDAFEDGVDVLRRASVQGTLFIDDVKNHPGEREEWLSSADEVEIVETLHLDALGGDFIHQR